MLQNRKTEKIMSKVVPWPAINSAMTGPVRRVGIDCAVKYFGAPVRDTWEEPAALLIGSGNITVPAGSSAGAPEPIPRYGSGHHHRRIEASHSRIVSVCRQKHHSTALVLDLVRNRRGLRPSPCEKAVRNESP